MAPFPRLRSIHTEFQIYIFAFAGSNAELKGSKISTVYVDVHRLTFISSNEANQKKNCPVRKKTSSAKYTHAYARVFLKKYHNKLRYAKKLCDTRHANSMLRTHSDSCCTYYQFCVLPNARCGVFGRRIFPRFFPSLYRRFLLLLLHHVVLLMVDGFKVSPRQNGIISIGFRGGASDRTNKKK